MNVKLFFKISVLIFGLIMVIFASRYFSSTPFQNSLQNVFEMGSQFEWCSTEKQKMKWLHEKIAQKVSAQQAKNYCLVQMESIQNIDLKQARWEKIAQGVDSGGQVVYLEWDPTLHVYRAAGLPFKSSILDKAFAY